MANEINLEIVTQINDSLKSLVKLQDEAKKTFTSIEQSAKNSAKAQEESAKNIQAGFSKAFTGIKIAATAALAVFASREIVQFFQEGIKAAAEEQEALNKLNFTLRATGRFTEETSQSFQNFAENLERSTLFSAEQGLASVSLLASMTDLSKNGLERAATASANLAAQFNLDLEQATRIVGRAIDGNANSLKKFGIQVDTSGSKAEVYARIMESLEGLNGAAAAKTNTFTGSIAKLGDAFADIGKELFKSIVQNETFVSSVRVLASIVKQFAEDVGRGGGFGALAEILANLSASVLPFIIKGFDLAATAALRFARGVFTILSVFLELDITQRTEEIINFGRSLLGLSEDFSFDGVKDGLDATIDSINTLKDSSDTAFDNAFRSSLKFSQSVATLSKQVKESEKSTIKLTKAVDDSDETFKQTTQNVSKGASAYDSLVKKVGELSDEQRKRGASAEDLARFEFEDTIKLINAAEEELKSQKKLTAETEKQIKQARELAASKLAAKTPSAPGSEERDLVPPSTLDKFESIFSGGISGIASSIAAFANPVSAFTEAASGVVDAAKKAINLIPNLLAGVADVFNSLAELPNNIAKNLSAVFKSLVNVFRNLLKNVVTSLGSIVRDAFGFILRDLPEAVTAALTELPEIINQVIGELPNLIIGLIERADELVEALVVASIEAQPRIAIALVDSLITNGGAFRIGFAIAEAMAIEVPKAIVQGIINGAQGVGTALANAFKNGIATAKIGLGEFSEDTKRLLKGTAIADSIKKVFNEFIDKFKAAIKQFSPQGIASGAGNIFSNISGALPSLPGGGGIRLAKGGTVYARDGVFVARGTDTVPAMLTPGETLVSRGDTNRLSEFLDRELSSREVSSQPSVDMSQVVRLLGQLVAATRQTSSEPVSINLSIGEKQLSEVLVNLNRQGFRTA